jgi:hypothetical protein
MSNFDPRSTDRRWGPVPPRPAPIIDMTPDGGFIDRPQPGVPPIPARIMGVAILVAILGAGMAIALLALWLALTLIPIVLGAGLIAYGVYRVQLWSAGRHSLGGKRDLFRP